MCHTSHPLTQTRPASFSLASWLFVMEARCLSMLAFRVRQHARVDANFTDVATSAVWCCCLLQLTLFSNLLLLRLQTPLPPTNRFRRRLPRDR